MPQIVCAGVVKMDKKVGNIYTYIKGNSIWVPSVWKIVKDCGNNKFDVKFLKGSSPVQHRTTYTFDSNDFEGHFIKRNVCDLCGTAPIRLISPTEYADDCLCWSCK